MFAYTWALLERACGGLYLRFFYNLVISLVVPLFLLRMVLRGLRYGDYHRRLRERFGWFARPGFSRSLWVHAVSLGEVNAAAPLIESLLRHYPSIPVVVTTGTPTGSARVRQLFGERVFHVYAPYDLYLTVRRFLRRTRPLLGIVVETEIWPNLFWACRARGIPLMVANARISSRSLRGYMPLFRSVMKSALSCVRFVAAQSRLDAARYRLLGAKGTHVSVVGNLKFDVPVDADLSRQREDLRASWGSHRPVWVAASTHMGEEDAVLLAHVEVLRRMPDALLLLAPRHPERFREVEQRMRARGFAVAVRSRGELPGPGTQCFLIDVLGELMGFYASADVAFVGGSLVPIGGHNILEPASLGCPVLVGPHTANIEGICRMLVRDGGAMQMRAAEDLGVHVVGLLQDPERRARMGERALDTVQRQRGSVRRVMDLVARIVPPEV